MTVSRILQTAQSPPPPPRPPPPLPPLPLGLISPAEAFNRSLFLNDHERDLGLTLIGAADRLRRKLRAGLPITLMTLGASNTVRGGCHKWQGDTRCAADQYTQPHPETGRPRAWIVQAFDAINRTWPHPQHRLINRGVMATHAKLFADCQNTYIPVESDLVMLSFNDMCTGFFHDSLGDLFSTDDSIAVESIVRGVLQQPDPPAVLIFNTHRFACSKYHVYCGFTQHSETAYELIAQYYQVSSSRCATRCGTSRADATLAQSSTSL